MHPAGSNENQSTFKLSPEDAAELKNIRVLLWGASACDNYHSSFVRWSQGFVFSSDEQSALVQNAGGPCSVIATVQAYILKHLIMELPASHHFKDLTSEKCKTILIKAVCNMLINCKEKATIRIVLLDKLNADVEKALESSEQKFQEKQKTEHMEISLNHDDISGESDGDYVLQSRESDLSPDHFHERLFIHDFDTIEEVEKFYSENFNILSNRYGVLLHLYSVLFTKGIDNVLNEISDTSEPLIHSSFGYGSQSLINLMLTGRAVQHVFDNDQNIGGMKLKGIDRQSDIGFITLMEQLRYCTVGSFYKNPKHPIWVMGSETHLTVLFSNEKSLVSPETPAEHARRIFSQYDTENSSFISSAVLQDILSALGLESDAGYVEIMRKKLDPDGTSIILLSDFMYEFFPDDKKSTPDTFNLYHYNGIPNSNDAHKVRYSHGKAILLESHIGDMCSQSNPMLTCLQTKWPNIEINWDSRVPSLN
ncbi:CLUMA_CG020123, isoform A [Clunio marinus]|uniref:Ubiquitin carboxyl-terminal hydrolase MINDY n=1 Tax=Clunio marinus TaxID=568069 RepID=A0A1J1J3Y8_9DIPT|nr:CLUMA_CG020123, isoform A [Clunio marinus]